MARPKTSPASKQVGVYVPLDLYDRLQRQMVAWAKKSGHVPSISTVMVNALTEFLDNWEGSEYVPAGQEPAADSAQAPPPIDDDSDCSPAGPP